MNAITKQKMGGVNQIKGGLLPLEQDDRDFQLGAIFYLPKLETLPEKFRLEPLKIKHQGGSDYCSAFASTSMSELQEEVELSPLYSFALSKVLSGNPEAWGQNMRDAMKAHVKYGAIEEDEAEYKITKDLKNENVRYYENWAVNHEQDLIEHRKKSYFKVTGGYDMFDNIRAAIWKFREQKQAVSVGLVWSWQLSDTFLRSDNAKGGQFGHMMYCIGWEKLGGEDYLVVVNSYGKEAGDNGVHYVSRDVINADAGRFGAYMMVDLEREDVEYLLDNGINDEDNWLTALFKVFISLIKGLWKK